MKRARFDGRRFYIEGHRGEASFIDLLKWQFSGGRAKWPKWIENTVYHRPQSQLDKNGLAAMWLGQSTVLLQFAGCNLLTDPFLSLRASPFQWAGPKRVRAPGLNASDLPHIDVVLVSHNHYDHMDLPALRALGRLHEPHVVTPLGNARHIRKASSSLDVTELDWSGSVRVGNLKITATPAWHWSKRRPFDTNQSLWSAFVIESPAGLVYFAGDTGFGDGSTFREIKRDFGSPRLSLIPIGAYEPRWFMKPQHMNPADAVQAHIELSSALSLAIHHETIQLTDEPIDAPRRELSAALAERGVSPSQFLCPNIGEPLVIP